VKHILAALALSAIISSCNPPAPIAAPTITAVTATATATTLNASATTALTATVTGTGAFDGSITWSLQSGGGTLSATTGSSVTYSAPSAIAASTTVIKATSTADSSKSASVTITINSSTFGSSVTGVTVTATKVAMREASSSTLQGAITGTGAFDPSVSWAIESGGVGTLSATTGSSVVYTAPSVSAGKVVRITASSVQDATKKRTLFVSVNPVRGSISAGLYHNLALTTDGTVLSWGDDSKGQLGDDSNFAFKTSPVFVAGLTNVVAVAAGYEHSLALLDNGTVDAWGLDNEGQLGNGAPLVNQALKVQTQISGGVIAIAANGNYSLALTSGGQIISWGSDDYGQLGNGGTNTDNPSTGTVTGAQNNNVAIAAGPLHALALQADGTVLTWGDNAAGQLGIGAAAPQQTAPVQITSLQNIVALSAGYEHALALKSDGTLLAWGGDSEGQLGDSTALVQQSTPVAVQGSSEITGIASGLYHNVALKADGTLLAWGNNLFKQLGNGSNVAQPIPVLVSSASGIVAISAGTRHSVALKADGTLLAWGWNAVGQLGLGGSVPGTDQGTPSNVLLGTNRIRVP
jgi:alpha-tubulin suppressor-like RCC1 family protein